MQQKKKIINFHQQITNIYSLNKKKETRIENNKKEMAKFLILIAVA